MLQHPVPEKILIHIGDMTVSFALLESSIKLVLAMVMDGSARNTQIISTYLSFRNSRAATISFYKEKYGEDDNFIKLKDFMSAAAKIEEERNKITHSIWAVGENLDSVTRIKHTANQHRGFHIDLEQYNEAKLIQFTDEIKSLAAKLQAFCFSIIKEASRCELEEGKTL